MIFRPKVTVDLKGHIEFHRRSRDLVQVRLPPREPGNPKGVANGFGCHFCGVIDQSQVFMKVWWFLVQVSVRVKDLVYLKVFP